LDGNKKDVPPPSLYKSSPTQPTEKSNASSSSSSSSFIVIAPKLPFELVFLGALTLALAGIVLQQQQQLFRKQQPLILGRQKQH
jgi:hypothetical protein